MPDIKKLAKDVWPYVVEMRRDFHRHPEPSYHEFRTTDRIAEELDGGTLLSEKAAMKLLNRLCVENSRALFA